MANINERFSRGEIKGEGKMSYLCGPISPTTELGKGVNGAGVDASFGASQGSGERTSPCGTWLCQPRGQTQ